VLVLAIDDVDRSVDVATMVRQNFPQLTIVARARNVTHYYQLYELGIRMIERETLDSALMSARSTLETLGWEPHQARNLALRFRRHNVAQLQAMAPHRQDEAKLIAAAKQGRQQLEELFALEREQAQLRQARSGWAGSAESLSLERETEPTA
jgi:glutathione-regulated potassium-efflux system ancillary protein KefC